LLVGNLPLKANNRVEFSINFLASTISNLAVENKFYFSFSVAKQQIFDKKKTASLKRSLTLLFLKFFLNDKLNYHVVVS